MNSLKRLTLELVKKVVIFEIKEIMKPIHFALVFYINLKDLKKEDFR